MKTLYLLRHGIAIPYGTPDIPDDERPLTEKGERRMRQVAYGLKTLQLGFDKVVTSPLPRAFRTAEILARVLGNPDLLESSDVLRPGVALDDVVAWLKTRAEANLLLVGHNPSLSLLIGKLVLGVEEPQICNLRRAGIAALSSMETDEDRMQIDWIARPRLIRRFADK